MTGVASHRGHASRRTHRSGARQPGWSHLRWVSADRAVYVGSSAQRPRTQSALSATQIDSAARSSNVATHEEPRAPRPPRTEPPADRLRFAARHAYLAHSCETTRGLMSAGSSWQRGGTGLTWIGGLRGDAGRTVPGVNGRASTKPASVAPRASSPARARATCFRLRWLSTAIPA